MSEKHEHGGHDVQAKQPAYGLVIGAIILVLLFYFGLLSQGLPQHWTKLTNEHHPAPAAVHEGHAHAAHDGHEHAAHDEHDHTAHEGHDTTIRHRPPSYMIAPFALLLLAIAVLPLIKVTEHWWESNLHRFYVAAGLGLITLLYYAFACDFPVEQHWPAHAFVDPAKSGGLAVATTIFINAIIADFIPFIVLLFSLFTITGGIRIEGDLKASPLVNSVILFLGAMLASLVGTTGAAMLLIRLLLETNKERKFKVHTVVFFIFAVCNCGGCLTPLGDPPLFLGYLKGVAFTWTLELYKEWLFVNCILVALYFFLDTLFFYSRESKEDKAADEANRTGLKISGLAINLPLLLGVVAAVALLSPNKPVPGSEHLVKGGWYPWFFLREIIQLGLCALSLALGSRKLRTKNAFNFAAIIEVAALFFGIFICMQAPLQILGVEGKSLGINTPTKFFWATGSLSSVLDNAPTYVVFFETAKTLSPNTEKELLAHPEFKEKYEAGEMVPVTGGFIEHDMLVAIALGAVFMGAMTYIGNGPNFMVKAIAEQSGVKMPSFFGYMVYSLLILLPIYILMNVLFLLK